MIKFKELSSLVNLCKEFGCSEGAKQFSELRSRALGRSFCEFPYECEQVVEELSQKSYPNSLIVGLNRIVQN